MRWAKVAKRMKVIRRYVRWKRRKCIRGDTAKIEIAIWKGNEVQFRL